MYIEINLLPKSYRPKKRLIRLDFKSVMIIVVICAAVGVGGYYYYLRKESAAIDKQIAFYKQEEVKMRAAVALNKEVNDLKKVIEERVGIIKSLTGDTDVRFAMLEHVNKVTPSNLWLLNINETLDKGLVSYTIEGMSYSKDDISLFIAGLEKFDGFTSVSLESIRPAPLEIRDAFSYVVKVVLKTTTPAVAEADASTAKRRPARR